MLLVLNKIGLEDMSAGLLFPFEFAGAELALKFSGKTAVNTGFTNFYRSFLLQKAAAYIIQCVVKSGYCVK